METMAGTGMDTQVLVILGSAFGVMFATLTTLMFTSMRLHHRDNIKTRELIKQATEKFQTQLEQATEKLKQATEKFQTQLEQATEKFQTQLEQATEKFQTQLEQATEKSRKLIKQETKKLTTDFKEDSRVTQGKLDKVVTSLSDARERLARIEGHLGIELPSTTEPESNGDNSEAA